jgi:bacteriochlorophyllide a dehydrogenase
VQRLVPIDEQLGERGILLALAATAYHALSAPGAAKPERIVGHGVLGRLLARLTIATGGDAPIVWERNRARAAGSAGYQVLDPADDAVGACRVIYDASGDSTLLDALIARLAPGGEVVLAGFYSEPLSFAFPPAFMREARIRVAAEWRQPDLLAVKDLVDSGRLSLDGLITHREDAKRAAAAYGMAFDDPACLKMILDWRAC